MCFSKYSTLLLYGIKRTLQKQNGGKDNIVAIQAKRKQGASVDISPGYLKYFSSSKAGWGGLWEDGTSIVTPSFLLCDLDSVAFFGRFQRQMHFSNVCISSLKFYWWYILGLTAEIRLAELIVLHLDYLVSMAFWYSISRSSNIKPAWTFLFCFVCLSRLKMADPGSY